MQADQGISLSDAQKYDNLVMHRNRRPVHECATDC